MNQLNNTVVGFIGAGHLTRSMIFGLVKSNFPINQIWLTNRSEDKLEFFKNQGINTSLDNEELVKNSDLIILATRPIDLLGVLNQIAKSVQENQLIISVVAGIESGVIKDKLHDNQPIIRSMPNTPSSVQTAMTGLWANEFVIDNHKKITTKLFKTMGDTLWLNRESLIHSVTAISGSGPAYILYFIETMVEAGIKIGLTRKDARKLAIQTAKGAAIMAELSNESLAELVNHIALKGGVTAEAINVFKKEKLKKISVKAITAAYQKSKNI